MTTSSGLLDITDGASTQPKASLTFNRVPVCKVGLYTPYLPADFLLQFNVEGQPSTVFQPQIQPGTFGVRVRYSNGVVVGNPRKFPEIEMAFVDYLSNLAPDGSLMNEQAPLRNE